MSSRNERPSRGTKNTRWVLAWRPPLTQMSKTQRNLLRPVHHDFSLHSKTSIEEGSVALLSLRGGPDNRQEGYDRPWAGASQSRHAELGSSYVTSDRFFQPDSERLPGFAAKGGDKTISSLGRNNDEQLPPAAKLLEPARSIRPTTLRAWQYPGRRLDLCTLDGMWLTLTKSIVKEPCLKWMQKTDLMPPALWFRDIGRPRHGQGSGCLFSRQWTHAVIKAENRKVQPVAVVTEVLCPSPAEPSDPGPVLRGASIRPGSGERREGSSFPSQPSHVTQLQLS
ncbi:hypothetical protein BC834DRAFT_997334 [Gloeopeniophorella convolvens]|nr:hypothetical protein BC834DRAFT_997334 [Gloeopeniophorella convolvens]